MYSAPINIITHALLHPLMLEEDAAFISMYLVVACLTRRQYYFPIPLAQHPLSRLVSCNGEWRKSTQNCEREFGLSSKRTSSCGKIFASKKSQSGFAPCCYLPTESHSKNFSLLLSLFRFLSPPKEHRYVLLLLVALLDFRIRLVSNFPPKIFYLFL